MAKLLALPEQDIIDGVKGTLDFYVHRGIPCCRSWPQYPPRNPTYLEALAQANFATIMQNFALLPAYLRDAYNRMGAGTPVIGRDVAVRLYLSPVDMT